MVKRIIIERAAQKRAAFLIFKVLFIFLKYKRIENLNESLEFALKNHMFMWLFVSFLTLTFTAVPF